LAFDVGVAQLVPEPGDQWVFDAVHRDWASDDLPDMALRDKEHELFYEMQQFRNAKKDPCLSHFLILQSLRIKYGGAGVSPSVQIGPFDRSGAFPTRLRRQSSLHVQLSLKLLSSTLSSQHHSCTP
jgi:hypothetical protein